MLARLLTGILLFALSAVHALAAPAQPVILAPVGDIATNNPELVWQDQEDATQFRVYVYDRASRTRVHLSNYNRGDVCNGNVCSLQLDLDLGLERNHRFYLRARDSSGWTGWTKSFFHYVDTVPNIVTPLAPVGEVVEVAPHFQWQEEVNATRYRLLVWDRDARSRLLSEVYDAPAICSEGLCSVSPAELNLPVNTRLLFRVRAYNSGGWNAWSPAAAGYFSIAEPLPVPVAKDDSATVEEGSFVVIPVLANDANLTGATVIETYVPEATGPVKGTLETDQVAGTITYTPFPGATGIDTFPYYLDDFSGESGLATVTVTIEQAPVVPLVANDDTASVDEGGFVVIPVLENDSGPTDASDIHTDAAPGAEKGTLEIDQAAGTITYSPFAGESGSDTFAYYLEGTHGNLSAVAIVSVTINPLVPPVTFVANDDTATVEQGGSVTIAVLANDTGPLDNARIETNDVPGPEKGTLVTDQVAGTISYTPFAGESGYDTFAYYLVDSNGNRSDTAVVTVAINSVPDIDDVPILPSLVSTFCPAYEQSDFYRARGATITISPTDPDWEQAIETALPGTEVLMLDGVYTLDRDVPGFPNEHTVYLSNPNVTIRSHSGNQGGVVIHGHGYPGDQKDIGFLVAADGITIADLTIYNMRDHAVSMNPISQADEVLEGTYLYNVQALDIGTQHIKGNAGGHNSNAVVACSIIGYSDGAAYGDYNGGIDIHSGQNVVLRDNYLYNITGSGNGCNAADTTDCPPYVSAPAIYMNGSSDSIVERNIVMDSFRGISLGLVDGHTGGIVRNNFVYREAAGDMGLSIENATDAVVEHNTVLVEGYFAPIETRGGSGHALRNNLTNKPIMLRDNTQNAVLEGNVEDAAAVDFVAAGDLHLDAGSAAVGAGVPPSSVVDDFDGEPRVGKWDAGADQIPSAGNEPPVAQPDTATVEAGASITIDVLDNDLDDSPLTEATINIKVEPQLATATVVNGEIVYAHDGADGFAFPTDTLTYSVTDSQGEESNTVTVTINITGINNPPLATTDNDITVLRGGTVKINVLANDTDPNNQDGNSPARAIDPATVTFIAPDAGDATQPPLNGTVQVNSDGTIDYTHDNGTSTNASFRYTVADLQGAVSAPAQVNITITDQPVSNVAPSAADDVLTVEFQSEGTVDVMDNDVDVDGNLQRQKVTIVDSPTQGSVVPLDDGFVSYLHTGDESGEDSFTYTVTDDEGLPSATTTVLITIEEEPVTNTAPEADDDSYFALFNDETTFDVLVNDTDDSSLEDATITIVNLPNHGTATVDAGQIVYQHDGSVEVSDELAYTVTDSSNAVSNETTVSITINTPPFATTDILTIERGASITFNVLDNDSDPDGAEGTNRGIDTTSVAYLAPDLEDGTQAPLNGEVTLGSDGSAEYTHNGEDNLLASFRYTVADLQGAVSIGLVDIRIEAPPVANDDTYSIASIDTQRLDVLSNDADLNENIDVSSIVIVDSPTHGEAVATTDDSGVVEYTYTGTDATSDYFTYRVLDSEGNASNDARVDISIEIDGVAGGLAVFHRDGQTFLTWDETDPSHEYHIYRSAVPITLANLGSATRLTEKWGPLGNDSSVNTYRGFDELPTHFVINALSPALRDDQGLFVYTTKNGDSDDAYYGVVSVSDGDEQLGSLRVSEAVSESVDQPTDVLTVQDGNGRIYTQFMDYSSWNPTLNGYIYNYSVALPVNYNAGQSYPLMIEPHAFDESPKFRTAAEFDWQVIQLFPYDPGSAAGSIHSWWYGYAADHDFRSIDTPSAGTVENFTEQRVMRAVQSLIADSTINVNEKLIHAIGNSMGASGAVSMALRYPSVLSGVYASQPMMDYRADTVFEGNFVSLWGEENANLPIVNRGPFDDAISLYNDGPMSMGVWDWMDHHDQLLQRRGDEFAFLMISHGENDGTIQWTTQGQPTVGALNNATVGFTAVANNNEHIWAGFDAVNINMFGLGFDEQFPWKYPIDLSFLAIQNATPELLEVPEDDNFRANLYNRDFEWATAHNPFDDEFIVDAPNMYAVTIKSSVTPKTVDVTPRRTQQFRRDSQDFCTWTATDLNDANALPQIGEVTADLDSLVTVKGVNIATGQGTRLVIDCQ